MNTVLPDKVGFSSSRLDRIRTAMQSYVDHGRLPGAVTMIARRGQVVHAECFGMRDIEARKPMRLDTLFPIFSMTKPILAVAMMILYAQIWPKLAAQCSWLITTQLDKKAMMDHPV